MVSFLGLLLVLPLAIQSGAPGTYASGADLVAMLDGQDGPMAVARIDNSELTRVNLIRRTVPQNAIVHATGWEVHHVTAGRGTIVTGGRLVRSTDAAGARVATIADGEARVGGPGDVIIVPAGTPHWYSEIEGSVSYLEVRYDPGAN